MADITEQLLKDTQEHVDEEKRRVEKMGRRPWQPWIDAEWGFRNHWYPALLSRDLPEGEHNAVQLLGEDILVTRQNGSVKAIEDRCPHRGIRFSSRPLFYTKETITCWYHTWTFDLDDGSLRTILSSPDSKVIGKCGVKTYPLIEAKGVIFIFVGDIEPPPLEHDLAPGFLDENAVVYCADPYDIASNWRLGCENGYDPGHQFIHNWSEMCINAGMHTSYGYTSSKKEVLDTTRYTEEESGPKGFTRRVEKTTFNHTAEIPLKDGSVQQLMLPLARGKSDEELAALTDIIRLGTVGLWMPCSLKVTTFPVPHCTHYEFYVPKNNKEHSYFQFGVIHTQDSEEAERWLGEDGRVMWEVPAVKGFTVDDAFARAEMQKFYESEDGWLRERLFQPDVELTMWRKFASKHARGIQTEDHAKGYFSR